MNFISALDVSSSGLSAQRLRMNVISSNLANIQTTRTADGGPYRRKTAIFQATPISGGFESVLQGQIAGSSTGVKVIDVIEDGKPARHVYDPKHPDADASGNVSFPNINLVSEMVDMMSATRSYEANVTAIRASKNMALKALEIGRQ